MRKSSSFIFTINKNWFQAFLSSTQIKLKKEIKAAESKKNPV